MAELFTSRVSATESTIVAHCAQVLRATTAEKMLALPSRSSTTYFLYHGVVGSGVGTGVGRLVDSGVGSDVGGGVGVGVGSVRAIGWLVAWLVGNRVGWLVGRLLVGSGDGIGVGCGLGTGVGCEMQIGVPSTEHSPVWRSPTKLHAPPSAQGGQKTLPQVSDSLPSFVSLAQASAGGAGGAGGAGVVGTGVGTGIGRLVGCGVGRDVGSGVGSDVGSGVGRPVGRLVDSGSGSGSGIGDPYKSGDRVVVGRWLVGCLLYTCPYPVPTPTLTLTLLPRGITSTRRMKDVVDRCPAIEIVAGHVVKLPRDLRVGRGDFDVVHAVL